MKILQNMQESLLQLQGGLQFFFYIPQVRQNLGRVD